MWILCLGALSRLGSPAPAFADTETLSGLHILSNSLTWVWIPSASICLKLPLSLEFKYTVKGWVGEYCCYICNFYILMLEKDSPYQICFVCQQSKVVCQWHVCLLYGEEEEKGNFNIPMELDEPESLAINLFRWSNLSIHR